MPNFLDNAYRLPFMTVTLTAYQFSYLYLKHSRHYYKFLNSLFITTYLYFMYMRIYPFLSMYRYLLHSLYLTFLVYQALHNLNRFAFQFETVIRMMDMMSRDAYELILSENIRRAVSRRLREELRNAFN